MEIDQNLIETELMIDSTIMMHLKETAVWGKLLGIIGFVYSGLIALGAIFAGSMFSKLSGNYNRSSEVLWLGVSVSIIYLAIAAVVFIMSMYLFRFAHKIQAAMHANDQDILTASFKNLKFYFRFAGIVTVIALIFTLLGVLGFMLATAVNQG